MSSVELALWATMRRHHLDADLKLCHLYSFDELHGDRDDKTKASLKQRQSLPFEIENFRGKLDNLYDSDVILFWGDFPHAHAYGRGVADLMMKAGLFEDDEQARQSVSKHLYLSEASDQVVSKVLSFGTTMIFDRPHDERDNDYFQPVSRLLSKARRVWMREPYSALKVARIRNSYDHFDLGVDCSTLLHAEDIEHLERTECSATEEEGSGDLGVFFGRSNLSAKILGKFVRDLSKKVGLTPFWLPWGDETAFNDFSKDIQSVCPSLQTVSSSVAPTIGDLYTFMKRFRFIVSDTYHVCVNAWRMGIPAVCIGQAVNPSSKSISSGKAYAWRDKRQTFYAMYDAMDYYVYAEEIKDRSWRDRRIYQLSQLVLDCELPKEINTRLLLHRDAAELQLVNEIRSLLASNK